MENDRSKVSKFFHGYAGDFDAIYGHTDKRNALGRWIDTHLRAVMRLRFEETLKHTAKKEIRSILDVGCGPGRYSTEFLKQGKDVVALDIAEGMLALARKSAGAMEHNGSISFIKADYLENNFPEKIDAACLMGFFDYIRDPVTLMKKLKKEISKEIYASFPKNSGLLALIRRMRYRLRNCPLFLYSRYEIEKILDESGLAGQYTIQDFGRDYYVKIVLLSSEK
jgi:SAM-dependent methyltransferase